EPPRGDADPPGRATSSSLETRKGKAGRVDLLAQEEPALVVPWKEDRDLPGEVFARGRDPEPLALVRGGHVRLLADALRPDHDVGQLEVDVGEGAEQAQVEARRPFVALPSLARLDELVDAVLGQRRNQA